MFFSNLIRHGVARWVRFLGLVVVVAALNGVVWLWNYADNPQTMQAAGPETPACTESVNSLASPSGASFVPQYSNNPGKTSQVSVVFDGTQVDFWVTTPVDFRPEVTAPVLLMLPTRSEHLAATDAVVRQLESEAIWRGWVVVTPQALGGGGFDDRIADFVPAIVEWINVWVTPEGGRPHLAGVANSGVQAFDVAAAHPGAFASLTVYPGFAQSSVRDLVGDELCSMPVRMWVGSDDGWITSAEHTRDWLRAIGGDVRLTVIDGAGHALFRSQDIRLFDTLDELRSG